MRKKIFFLLILLLSNAIVFGKDRNDQIKNVPGSHKNNIKPNDNSKDARMKRSLGNKAEKIFLANIGHELMIENPNEDIANQENALDQSERSLDTNTNIEKNQRVLGIKGRENEPEDSNIAIDDINPNDVRYNMNTCEFCDKSQSDIVTKNKKEDINPFWGSRGRRESFEVEENNPLWGNRGRRQEEPPFWGNRGRRGKVKQKAQESLDDLPFWASRGRRDEIEPFWGNRGRRDEMEPFWGNRGRRDETEPFWGNRGRRDEMEPFWGNRGRRDETEPFWGNRGRRDNTEPFWGNRGRRDNTEPFWGSRGRRDDSESFLRTWDRINDGVPFWGNRGRRQNAQTLWGNRAGRDTDTSFWRNKIKELSKYWTGQDIHSLRESRARKKIALTQSIINGMNDIEYDIDNLARMRRGDENTFWNNRGRDSKLKYLFNDPSRNKAPYIGPDANNKPIVTQLSLKAEPNTVHDDRIYAEEPRYILIERSSRSSAEDDPFFITRGKKYSRFKLPKGERDRRGAIEDLVKSVRNDPYYIARGKKDSEYLKIKNVTLSHDEYVKSKELICSTIDLLVTKHDGQKFKRDVDYSERERRTILKKLAAQLQIDPYFVSRGKKSVNIDNNDKRVEEFIKKVALMC